MKLFATEKITFSFGDRVESLLLKVPKFIPNFIPERSQKMYLPDTINPMVIRRILSLYKYSKPLPTCT